MSIHHLLKTVQKLRSKNGCPWDLEQTHESLFPYLIEEAYEVIESYNQDPHNFKEELGDLLLQIVLHCQISSEAQLFNFNDVANSVNKKMIRRHPHVFADKKVCGSSDVLENWENIKLNEETSSKAPKSLLSGVPKQLPALLKAYRIGEKVANIGFDWNKPSEVFGKIKEEIFELEEALKKGSLKEIEMEFGDLLFSLVNLGRHLDVNAEIACDKSNQKFIKRFTKMIEIAKKTDLHSYSLAELEDLWSKAKSELDQSSSPTSTMQSSEKLRSPEK